MKTAAIIPARGGSRGVPEKNLMSIHGRRLLGHAIQCCQQVVDTVLVTTDCPRIRSEAEWYGAQVVERPAELATDDANSQDALRHALQFVDCEQVAFVQCTAPLLDAADIRGCLDKLPDYDLMVCCVPFDGLVLGADGRYRNFAYPISQRRQDREPQYVVNGHCWAMRPDYLQREWMSGRVGIHEAAFPYRLEIDTPEDVELARAVLENHLCGHRQHALSYAGDQLCGGYTLAGPYCGS